jgi:hypothetical protein
MPVVFLSDAGGDLSAAGGLRLRVATGWSIYPAVPSSDAVAYRHQAGYRYEPTSATCSDPSYRIADRRLR